MKYETKKQNTLIKVRLSAVIILGLALCSSIPDQDAKTVTEALNALNNPDGTAELYKKWKSQKWKSHSGYLHRQDSELAIREAERLVIQVAHDERELQSKFLIQC